MRPGCLTNDADELLQAFVTDRLLEHQLLQRADQARGRFRSLLLTSLNNFAAGRRRAARVREAASLEEDAVAAKGSLGATPEAAVWADWSAGGSCTL